jgi:hypothetical protein
MMSATLLINTNHLKPLLKEDWDGPCASCGKKRARWMFIPSDEQGAVSVCGLCWMYESQWGKNRASELAEFKAKVEREIGKSFLVDKGKLVQFEDADRLLSAIALTSQIFQIQGASP